MTNVLNGASTTGAMPALPQQAAGTPSPGIVPQQDPQQGPPQVTHQQAVASLRHFSAISRQLEALLQNPDLGKSDVKSKIIDGTTKLVASRVITPGQAVIQLGTVPADPLMQRKWVQQHFQQTMVAMNAVLDHHAQTNPGTGDLPTEIARSTSKPDDHLDDMNAVNAHYQGGKRG